MKRLQQILFSLFLAVPLFIYVSPAFALSDTATAACTGTGGTVVDGKCVNPASPKTDIGTAFHTVANVLIFLVAAISVIMIIIGGMRYVLSGGDSAGVKGAKDTILYAVIGVVVAILAYAIVNFVISRFQ